MNLRHDCLLMIQGIRLWWFTIGSKSLGIWFEYSCELILTWIWNWDVCEYMRMKWMKSTLDNFKYSMLNFYFYLIKIQKEFLCVFVIFVVYLSFQLRELSCVAQVPLERTIFITCYVRPVHLPFSTNNQWNSLFFT